jgi:hypothetical protein
MLKKILSLIIITISIILVACEKDVFVKDISGKTVNVLAPADGAHTPNNSMIFWWEEMDGAERYNIQIVSPSFAAVQQLHVDTNVTGNKFTVILQPGTYQWRIKGVNNGGSSSYVTRTLVVDTTSNLAYLTVALTTPLHLQDTSASSITMSWAALSAATSYNVIILNSSGGTLKDTNLTATAFTYSFAQDGTYTWRVRAENSFSVSQYSVRTLIIDRAAPAAPVLVYPADNAFINLSDSVSWSRQGDAIYDSLFIASDTNFNAASTLNRKIRETTSNTYYSIDALNGFISGQTYYWKLKSVDGAGNISVFTARRKFHVN